MPGLIDRTTQPAFLRRSLRRLLALVSGTALSCAALAADPQITSFIDQDPVPAGGIYQYDIRVDNNAADAATNTVLTLTVPAGATFVSASPAGANCVLQSTTTVVCTLGTVGGNGADVRDVAVRWRANGPGPATIASTATLSASNDTNAGNNTQAQTTSVISGANLALTKAGSPNPVLGGVNITYTLTASNSGPNASAGIVITDNLPPSVSFTSAAGSGWTCSHSAGVVTCSRPGPHAVGAAIPPITLIGTVNASGGTVTNSATVAPAIGGTADPDTSNNTATVDTVVLPGADVRINQKTVSSPLPAVAGSNVTFVIQPRNGGPATATDVTVTDPLPAGWTFVSASGPNWSCSNAVNTVSCTRASMPAGTADNITIVATAPSNAAVAAAGQSFTNTASISATSTDPNGGNNSGSVSVPVLRDGADLRIAKSKTPNPVAQGANMTSSITVTNNGPRTATGPLRVVELLTGESFIGASGTGWSCTSSAPTVSCDHPNAGGLAVGASLPVLSIVTRADVNGSSTNTACTGASLPAGAPGASTSPPVEGDPSTGNDCASVSSNSTTVQPDLSISKLTSTPAGGDKTVSATEGSVTYTLLASNVSAAPQAATGVVITDTVPAFIAGRSSFASITATPSAGSTATFSCIDTIATVTCTQSGGQLLQTQSVTVVITVNRPLQDGSFTNTATVGNTVEGDPNSANNSASDTVVITPIADVEMTGKSVSPGTVRAGEIATYVLSFRNNGPSTATGVTVSDGFTFPVSAPADSGLTVVDVTSSKSGSSCSIAAGAVLTAAANAFNCTIGTLANGETQSITLRVRPNFQIGNGSRTFTNLARVNTSSVESPAGGDNGNNERGASLTVSPAALDLLVNKTDRVGSVNLDPVPFLAGGSAFMGYQVAVTNNGPSYGTDVRISENMVPPSARRVRFVCDVTSFGSATCNATSLCSATNITSAPGTALPTFTCSVPAGTSITGAAVGELASGATKNIFLRFEALDQPAPAGDIYNNTATALANEPDTQPANDSEGEQTTTRQRVDLRTTKTPSVASPTLMQPFNWLINVVNNGPGNSLQTDLTDTLPPQAQVTGPITWTRTLQPASGTCTLNGATASCALGQLDAGGSATITVPVRITSFPSGGTLTNIATVDTDPNKTGGIDDPGGNNTGTSTLTIQRSSLAGTVFQDRDRTGASGGTPQSAATEPRIAGVTITLTGTDAYGNTVNRTTTTDSNGDYVFNNLAPSNGAGYTITQTQPSGFDNSPVAVPSSGGGAPSLGGNFASGGSNGNSSYGAVAVGAADTGTRYNFPELRRPSLSGFVYIDVNADNQRNAGTDLPIANATVRLLDASTLAVLATTTTSPTGAYSFGSLDPLTAYVLEQPLPGAPTGLISGAVNPGLIGGAACATGCTAQPNAPVANTDRIAAIDLSSGADGTAFNFGEIQQTFISGLVWVDSNRNAVIDPAETTRLGGVTLRLVQGTNCSGTVLQTTPSDANGNYAFSGVSAGLTYTVCQTQPVGYADGAVIPGASAASSAANSITISNLPLGGSAGNHFGERVGSVAGSVYLDANNDGQRQSTDSGILGVTITLTGTDAAGNAVNRTTTTDASGNYRFDDVLAAGPGSYTLTEQAAQPVVGGVTTLDGRTTAGSTAGSSSGSATPGVPSTITAIALAAGADSTDNRFGEILPVGLSGTVFIDINDNGVQNAPGDTGLPNVVLVITGSDDRGTAVSRNVTTAADGSWSAPDLRPGTYTVTEPTQPAGTINGQTLPGSGGGTATAVTTAPSAISDIVLTTPGAVAANNNFAEIANDSAIAGRVWLDANNNGLIDGTEAGIAGVTLELSGTDAAGRAVTRTTTTDATGAYRFADLAPGNYSVREPVQPAGTVNGATVPGSRGGTATAVATAPSAIAGIVLGVGESASANNFAEVPSGQISGQVYADNNNNGVVDPGETGLGGVTLILSGTDDQGNAVNLTVTTGSDGRYTVPDLRPGTYAVTQPTQPPGTVGGITTPGSLGGTGTAPSVAISGITAIVLPPGGQAAGNNFGEIGNSPDLRVSKLLVEPRLTVGFPGTYRISVRNVGELPSSGIYTLSDRLPTGLTLAATPTGTGWACAGALGASSFTCTSSTVIGAAATGADAITATVTVSAAAATAAASATLNNTVLIDGGGEIDARRPSAAERDAFANNAAALPVCATPAAHNACRTPTAAQQNASLSGTVWYDTGSSSRLLDGGDRRLPGWGVEVIDIVTGAVVGRATTGTDGSYRVPGLFPGVSLAVRFRDPASGVVFGYPVNGDTAPGSSGAACVPTAALGTVSSCVGSGANPALTVVLAPGQDLLQQSLPVDPSGVVYDSGLRQPVPGSIVSLEPVGACAGWTPATGLVSASLGGYTVNGSRVSMTVGSEGFYQFLFAPAAPASCTWQLAVTPPTGYTFQSTAIPPAAGPLLPGGAAGSVFNVQPQAAAPSGAVGPATTYYLGFTTGSGGSNIIHNHIPLDPFPPSAIALLKSGDKAAAEVGDSVRYSITVSVTAGARPRQTTVVDRLPAGFTYIRGTAMVGDVPIADPAGGLGPTLAFNLGPMSAGNQLVLRYRVRVGVGAAQGDGINRARGHACGAPAGCVDGTFVPVAGSVPTNESAYRVRINAGVFTTDACVLGKIFVDCNNNHVQDAEELGIPGVRLLMQDGTTLISDSEGKYSVCGVAPKSAVLKVDPLTLPRGSRLTTSSNRNLGDAGSLWLDLKNGELHRADFIEGSCSNTVLEQVKARRAQGEVRAPEPERKGGPALRFDSKAHGLSTTTSPQQGTDGANQQAPKTRKPAPASAGAAQDETNVPATELPMNRPPPQGRDSGTAPDAGGAK